MAALPIVPSRSALGKAMNDDHRQWPKLTVYVEDGRLRMDNKLTENGIRPFVIGRIDEHRYIPSLSGK